MIITFILQIEKWNHRDEVMVLRCLQDIHLSLNFFLTGMLEIQCPTLSKSGDLVISDRQQGVSRSDVCDHLRVGSLPHWGIYYYGFLWCSKEMKCIFGHSMVESPHPEFLNNYVE